MKQTPNPFCEFIFKNPPFQLIFTNSYFKATIASQIINVLNYSFLRLKVIILEFKTTLWLYTFTVDPNTTLGIMTFYVLKCLFTYDKHSSRYLPDYSLIVQNMYR